MITLFDATHILAYVVAAMLIGTFFVLFHIGLIYFREQDITREGRIKNAQLAAVMRSCNIRVWLMLPLTNRYVLLSERGAAEAEYAPIDFSNFCEGNRQEATCRIRSMRMADGQRHMYDVNIRVLRRNAKGQPTTILGLQRDITDKLEQQQNVNKLLSLYHTFFDSSIIDLMYYDKDGYLRDINEKACETFGIHNRQELLARGVNLKDIPAYRQISIENFEGYRMSTITNITKIRETEGVKVPEITRTGTIYYDTIAHPIYDENGQVIGIYTAGQSINEKVDSYHRQQESSSKLRETTRHIREYIDNINLALRVSEVRLMNYLPDTHEVEISNDLNTEKLRLPQLRCLSLVAPEFKHKVAMTIRMMDHRVDHRVDMTIRSTLRDEKHRDVWLTFSLIPMKQADGSVSHYFGMCRNETEMVTTAQQLKEESRKAQETELLKDAFLQNMSYEIRTPLSAVLGFAELLNADHAPEDEEVFIGQIKQNSNHLLQLVNEILFISKLDAHMVEIKKGPTDFAMLFDGWCHQGWSGHRPEVTTIIENPFEHLIVDIDDTNFGMVIQRLCAYAAAVTKEGAVRAHYVHRRDNLVICIEDSGEGLDAESVKQVFTRFVKNHNGIDDGIGLALPIAKALTEQMGGSIEFQSEPGKGSIVWVTMPAKAMLAERKEIGAAAAG